MADSSKKKPQVIDIDELGLIERPVFIESSTAKEQDYVPMACMMASGAQPYGATSRIHAVGGGVLHLAMVAYISSTSSSEDESKSETIYLAMSALSCSEMYF